MYDFDQVIERKGTDCVKWDMTAPFGVGPEADLIPMWIADMDFAVMPEVQQALKARCDHPIFGYNMTGPTALNALCGWYQRRHHWTFQPEQVVSGIGVVTMIRFTLETITAPGDRVATFSPVYDPFFTVIRNTGRTLVDVPLLYDGGQYRIDFLQLEQEMQQGLRAIILCNPHNPVGRIWSREELETLGKLCQQYQVYLLSDEVHGDIAMEGYHYTPMGTIDAVQDLLVVYTAISKSFNLAGLHQSALIIPNPELRVRIADALDGAWIKGANLLAVTAMEAAYTHGDTWVDELNAYLTENSRRVEAFCQQRMPQVKLCRHEGTFLMWLNLRCLGLSSRELTQVLGQRYGVGLHNGAQYGAQCDGFMRLNIACPRSTLERGLTALERAYQDLNQA
jgi:cystathionine beta-lyase